MKKFYFKWHRRLALIAGIPMLLWALSGILHPIMGNWFKAEIAHKFLPPQAISTTENIQPPSQVIPHNLDLQFLRLVNIDKSVAYLVETTEKEFHLFSAKTGEKLELNSYLTQQARLYADDPHSPLKSISRQDHFNNHYSTINRYLPVYRVALERKDGLEIMIDPRTGRMARFDKPYLRTLKTLFGWFHTYSFLGKGDNIFRVTVVTTLSTLGILIGLSGIANLILFRTKTASGRERRMGKGRRTHRILGGIAFIFFMLFGLSGLFHSLLKYNYDHSPQLKHHTHFSTKGLTVAPSPVAETPLINASIAIIGQTPYYRLAHQQGRASVPYYVNAFTTEILAEGEQQYLTELSSHFTERLWGETHAPTEQELVTEFGRSYGFIDRRLPVWKLSFPKNKTIYIDTQDAALSKVSTTLKTAEGISFSMLHKFHFIDPLSKEARDWVSSIGAGLIALTAIFGILLLFRKRA